MTVKPQNASHHTQRTPKTTHDDHVQTVHKTTRDVCFNSDGGVFISSFKPLPTNISANIKTPHMHTKITANTSMNATAQPSTSQSPPSTTAHTNQSTTNTTAQPAPSTQHSTNTERHATMNAVPTNVAVPFRADIVDISSDSSTDGYQDKSKTQKKRKYTRKRPKTPPIGSDSESDKQKGKKRVSKHKTTSTDKQITKKSTANKGKTTRKVDKKKLTDGITSCKSTTNNNLTQTTDGHQLTSQLFVRLDRMETNVTYQMSHNISNINTNFQPIVSVYKYNDMWLWFSWHHYCCADHVM